jgi:hypothetical protein
MATYFYQTTSSKRQSISYIWFAENESCLVFSNVVLLTYDSAKCLEEEQF